MSIRRKFLNKKAALAALAVSTAISAGADAAIQSGPLSRPNPSAEVVTQLNQVSPPADIVLEPAESSPAINVAWHSSHASHASHASHTSSRY